MKFIILFAGFVCGVAFADPKSCMMTSSNLYEFNECLQKEAKSSSIGRK